MNAFIFVPALVACVLLGFLFAMLAANAYLTVMQSTGSGSRDVVWTSEPFVDNVWKFFYLAWLFGLWLGPAWFIGQAYAKSDIPWMRYALPLSVFWLIYPLSQLSSLSGPSIWLPFHYDVFGRIARKPHILLGFFVLTLPVLALFGLGFHWTFNAEGVSGLFAGAPLLIVSALVYSRLLGRLAFSLMFTRSILARKKRKKKAEQWKPAESSPPPPEEDEFRQPSDLPPIQTPDEGDLTGYDIRFEDAPKKRVRAIPADKPEPERVSPRPIRDDDDDEAYGVHQPEVEPEAKPVVDIVKPSALEMKLLDRTDAPKPPKQVWTPQLLEFLFRLDTVAVIGLLTTLCLVFGGAVRLARAFNPVRGASD